MMSSKAAAYFSFFLQLLISLLLLLPVHVKSQCQKLYIMDPAYFDPTTNPQAWNSITSAASQIPSRVFAIANPSNGPGTVAQPAYTAAFSDFESNTGRVIGYVFTSYGRRASAEVKTDINTWFQFYPSISGIFFDETANTDGLQPYYQVLYNYVKSKKSSALVVNNPGGPTLESFLFYNGARVADVICTYENGVGGLTFHQEAWTKKYCRYNFLAQENIGWVYLTDDSLPNPWDTISSYFPNEVDYIKNDRQC